MAHIAKYKAHAVGHMLAHYRRDPSSLGRDNIDPDRVGRDYTFGVYPNPNRPDRLKVANVDAKPNWDVVARRIERVDAAAVASGNRRTRRDAVVMADLVVTLPDNVPPERERDFFGYTYMFLARRLGPDNLMGGFVHRDECRTKKVKDEETGEWVVVKTKEPVRDHMHVPFTPILDGRFNYKKMCPRTFYASLHRDLGDYLERAMGFRPHVELSEEEHEERVYADKSKDIDRVKRAVDAKTADARSELAEVTQQVAEKTSERDAVLVQLDQAKAQQVEEGAKLGALRAEVEKKQGLAADLSAQISEKKAEKGAIQAEISRFSEKRDAAEQRLECVQGDLAQVEGIAGAGLLELGKLAQGGDDGERERAAQAENRQLRARLAQLEEERSGLEGRVRGLEEVLAAAWRGLERLAERVEVSVEGIPRALGWVFERLGFRLEWQPKLALDSLESRAMDARDAARADNEDMGWEPPVQSHGRHL